MLRTENFKYVYHTRINEKYGPEYELYDLAEDPGEFNNLARLDEHQDRTKRMHALLVQELGRDPEEAEAECRRDYERGYSRTDI